MLTARDYRFRNAVAVALLAAGLTGCADLRWHKEGADAAALDRDLGECRRQVLTQARVGTFAIDGPRVVGVDERGRPIIGAWSRLETERMLLEHDLMSFCMRKKGYKLVPVEKR